MNKKFVYQVGNNKKKVTCLHVVDSATSKGTENCSLVQCVHLTVSVHTTVRGSLNYCVSVLDKAANFYVRFKPISIVDVR
jgi:hypothetical protein